MHLSTAELVRYYVAHEPRLTREDIERIVVELIADGLFHDHGSFVFLTQAGDRLCDLREEERYARHYHGPGEAPNEDEQDQIALLGLVAERHPERLSLAEIRHELSGGDDRHPAQNAIARALEELLAYGVIESDGDLAWLSPAAARFQTIVYI